MPADDLKATDAHTEPVPVLVQLRRHRADLDDWIERAAAALHEKRGLSCFACTASHCCNQLVQVSLTDALLLADRVRMDGRDTKAFRKLLRQRAIEQNAARTDEWLDRAVPCVFLEGGKCTVYDDRPTTCRAYYVGTPPELCGAPSRTEVGVASFVNDAQLENLKLTAHVAGELGLTDPAPIALLPQALLWVLEALDHRNPVKFLASKWRSL